MNEKFETFTAFFGYLKNIYKFNPKTDFIMSQIKKIQKSFPHFKIQGCFFHFTQSI